MVDHPTMPARPARVPNPAKCSNFAEWLRALVDVEWGLQKKVAIVCGVEPQSVTKWLQGGQVGPEKLRRLSQWTGVAYVDLRMLVDGHQVQDGDAPVRVDLSSTAADVGRKWQALPPELQVFVLAVLEGVGHMAERSPSAAAELMATIRRDVSAAAAPKKPTTKPRRPR